LQGQLPLVIPDDVLDKIKYLCKTIASVEWSGILFYKVEGSIRNADTVKFIAKDILPLDMGSSAYTEYEWGEEVANYLAG
jgi:hypothetical protein